MKLKTIKIRLKLETKKGKIIYMPARKTIDLDEVLEWAVPIYK